MRRAAAAGLVVGLVVGTALPSVAMDDDLRMGDDPAHYERVEVPEAGVAVSFPPGWEVEVELAYAEIEPGDPETGYWLVLFADGGDEGWCDVTRYLHPVGEIEDLAPRMADDFVAAKGGDASGQATPVDLPAGPAWRVDVQIPEGPEYVANYLIDPPAAHLGEPSRFTLTCQSPARDARDWLGIARTLEWLESDTNGETNGETAESYESADGTAFEPQVVFTTPAYELEDQDVEEAGIAISWPVDWSLEVGQTRGEYRLPAELADHGPVTASVLVLGESELGDWCRLTGYQDLPMTLEEQADWEAATLVESGFEEEAIEHSLWLVGGSLAERISLATPGTSEVMQTFLFESAGGRYDLTCASPFGGNPSWAEMAGSVVPLDAGADPDVEEPDAAPVEPAVEVPAGVPDDALAWDVVEDFPTVLPVSEPGAGGWLMSAWCDRSLWIEYADGTFEERLSCRLADGPVKPAEAQGSWPTEPRLLSGRACDWVSDFWLAADGSEVWASSWVLSVVPDGTVLGLSRYAAELLACEDE